MGIEQPERTIVNLSANHKAIKDYYAKRQQIAAQGATHELAVREAFKGLLESAGAMQKWVMVVEDRVEGLKKVVRPDGTLRDANTLPRGYWEAKDSRDNLEVEIGKKFERGYPKSNIIFEDTRQAILYQSGERQGVYDLAEAEQVAQLLNQFLAYTEPNIEGFEQAVERFKADTPEIARGLLHLIETAHKSNKAFQAAYATFYELCKDALNPNISRAAVDEMLIQHLLTERLMRTVFDNQEFTRRNAIAAEVEKVIDALTSQSFSRTQFLGQLNYLYEAIEAAAKTLQGFSERQHFINTVYERFFQGYAVKVADTHGIVYTPQPIVDFMCAAVEEVLRDEFNLSLADDEVCIIDPATGTGNFIINLLHRIHQTAPHRLPEVYQKRLFANEVMLLPYYVASLNIEHAYFDLTGHYAPFEGLCFVDTLDLAEGAQLAMSFITQKNSERVERQKQAPITVIIGNPPYNVGQLNENDNNKNRGYGVIDGRVRETYAKDSKATNKNALSDVYVKFFRWATDRLQGRDGVVCYVSNNSFIENIAFDGMRKHLLQDFQRVYVIDLKGNIRKDSMRDGIPLGEQHTVFGLSAMVGISIIVLVRNRKYSEAKVLYSGVDWQAKRSQKFLMLAKAKSLSGLNMQELKPDMSFSWLVPDNVQEFAAFLPIGSKETKSADTQNVETIFKKYSRGLETTRDNWVYDFGLESLIDKVKTTIEAFNSEVDRWRRAGRPSDIDNFVLTDDKKIKWSSSLKESLQRQVYAYFDIGKIRSSLYRPYSKQFVYFDDILNHRQGLFPTFFPLPSSEAENLVITVPGSGNRKEFGCFISNSIIALDFAFEKAQCFPFYVYDEDGNHRRENITDWALGQFRAAYGDAGIGKWDIFYYVYGLLHHPDYRSRYADNLKRELPRIPLVKSPHPPAPSPQSVEGESESPSMLGGEGLGVGKSSPELGVGKEKQYTPVLGDTYADRDLWEKLKPLARQMRHDPTLAEERLWQELRGKKLGGYKFRRQHPLDRFIADFYCHEARLVIEVDGPVHDYTPEHDALRQQFLESLGLRVLRFKNDDVLSAMDGVVERIYEEIMRPHPPTPLSGAGEFESPSMLGGEGFGVGKFSPESGVGIADDDASIFWAFSHAGRALAELHLNYETVTPFKLEYRWAAGKPISYRVQKMRLTKDKTALTVNDSLTLAGIPPAAFDYRLGNRSALDWVIDQYQVKEDTRSHIVSDPNQYSEDEKYIVELVGRVIAVSVQTVEIVNGLPGLGLNEV